MRSENARSAHRILSVEPGHVVLKDHIELLPGKDDEFMREWFTAAERIRKHEGFISMALYQNRKDVSEGAYTSVLVWKTLELLDAALDIEEFFQGKDTSYPPITREEEELEGVHL